jgi:L-lactate permease
VTNEILYIIALLTNQSIDFVALPVSSDRDVTLGVAGLTLAHLPHSNGSWRNTPNVCIPDKTAVLPTTLFHLEDSRYYWREERDIWGAAIHKKLVVTVQSWLIKNFTGPI